MSFIPDIFKLKFVKNKGMITIQQQPPLLLLARQQVVFKVVSNSTQTPLRLKGTVSGIGSDSFPADIMTSAQFEFSEYIRDLSDERYKLSASPAKYTDAIATAIFKFYEVYGTPATDHNELATSSFYVLDGKIPNSQLKLFYQTYASLLEYLVSTKACLTWWLSSEAKKVLPEQKEFLNYLQVKTSGSSVSLQLKVGLLFTDGTSADMGSVYSAVSSVAYMEMVYFPTGYTQLGIEAWVATNHPGKVVSRYYVTIYSGATPYSRVYSYEVDRGYYENSRVLYIRNPFGMLEVLLCTGLASEGADNSNEVAVTDGQTLPAKLSWKNTRTDVVKINTGHLSVSGIKWLADLLDTTEAYELNGTVLIPIVLHEPKIALRHDGDYLYNADLEYEYAFSQPIEKT